MSWPDFPRSLRLLAALGLAALVAGCFQPMYGDRAMVGGGASGGGLGNKLASVEVEQINAPQGTRLARLGVSVRDELIFALTGGGAPAATNYLLKVHLAASHQQVIVDINTARPDIQNYGIDSTYTLIDVTTGQVVVSGTTFARVAYNIPGQQQRFAGDRGLRDAENRAASVIVENIRNRLASYFVAGT